MVDIAIIGIGCRFPKVEGIDEFWSALKNGVDLTSDMPSDRWDTDDLFCDTANEPGKTYCKKGGFIQNAERFDAEFFGISESEAERMDPQQGMALEVCWQALEHAGIKPSSLVDSEAGVFMGVSTRDFDRIHASRHSTVNPLTSTGAAGSVVANRISYQLGLVGPCMAVDAACASSLSSVHLACQSLLGGECDLAFAGGVQLILSPANIIAYSQGGLLANDGICKSFSQHADGYSCGEGAGVVILKKLSDALADGNKVFAVIKGSAINHNGASNGLSAPLGGQQKKLIEKALVRADIAPETIAYIEAHSPGTKIGDMIEIGALKKVFCSERSTDNKCYVGSVKSNLGHLEAAAGIASLIKAVLTVYEGWIPKSLHSDEINPALGLSNSPLTIADGCKWPETEAWPRRAGVSAFGFGGGNAHLVLEQFEGSGSDIEQVPSNAKVERPALLLISANSEEALVNLAKRYRNTFEILTDSDADYQKLRNYCLAAATKREHLKFRCAFVTESVSDLNRRLDDFINPHDQSPSEVIGKVLSGNAKGVVAINTDINESDAGHLGSELLKNYFGEQEKIEELGWQSAISNFFESLGISTTTEVENTGKEKTIGRGRLVLAELHRHCVKIVSETGGKLAGVEMEFFDNGITHILAEFYSSGVNIDWDALYGRVGINACSLPVYPFQRKGYGTIW